jgi:hypothetical protein
VLWVLWLLHVGARAAFHFAALATARDRVTAGFAFVASLAEAMAQNVF